MEYKAVYADNAEKRRRNFELVMKYMETSGEERMRRWQMFTEDCVSGLGYMPERTARGIENRRKNDESLGDAFPDWKFSNFIVLQSEDPDYFVVECDGDGMCYADRENPFYYTNHYFHVFRLENGKIKLYLEYQDPGKEDADKAAKRQKG